MRRDTWPRRRRHRDTIELQTKDTLKDDFTLGCTGRNRGERRLDEGTELFSLVAIQCMGEQQASSKSLLMEMFESRPAASQRDRQLEVSTRVSDLIRTATSQTTIDEIVEKLFEEYQVSALDRTSHVQALRHLVFAMIGWCTMLYTDTSEWAMSDFSSSAYKTQRSHSIQDSRDDEDSWKRPIGTILRNRGYLPIECPPKLSSTTVSRDLLPVTHLNFFSLSRLGEVTVTWVNDLSQHCSFERFGAVRDIKLFRMPSLCAKVHMCDAESLIGRLSMIHPCTEDCDIHSQHVARSYLIEVLLSYRLLFGQDGNSRQLFRDRERERAAWDGKMDPLLFALCGEKYMDGFEEVSKLLRERSVYNAGANFPVLGQRLMDLEDYSMSQRPRNIVEVWNDQRDPERLLTFKAVIIFGAVAIFLGLMQVMLSIAQVVLAAKGLYP